MLIRLTLHLTIEKNGKTLHLLKASAKPTPAGRQRKKVQIMGTFGQYKESKKKPQAQNKDAPVPKILQQSTSGSSIQQYMAPAP